MKKWILGVAAAGLIILVIFPLGLSFAKVIRSRQHMEAAIQAKKADNDETAHYKIQSAYNLNPNYGPILEKVGPYAADVGHPKALDWWILAATRGLFDLKETIEMIEFGIRTGQLRKIRPFLDRYQALYPDSDQIKQLRLQVLLRERRDIEAYELSRELINRGNENLTVIAAYMNLAFSLTQLSPDEKKEALENLIRFSKRPDQLGLQACRTLFPHWNELDEKEKSELELRVRNHENATYDDLISLYTLKLRSKVPQAPLLESILTEYEEWESEENSETLARWLTFAGFYKAALNFLEKREPESNASLFFSRQLAWIGSGEPEKAYEATSQANPLTPVQNFVIRAKALIRQGRMDEAEETLAQSLEVVEADQMEWLENYLLELGFRNLAIKLHEKFLHESPNPTHARLKLIDYYYDAGNEIKLTRLLKEISLDDLNSFPREKIDYLYFSLLFHQNMDSIRSHIENLASQFPNIADFRILLAFSYAVSGNIDAGMRILDTMGNYEITNRPRLQIMAAILYGEKGNLDKGRQMLQNMGTGGLLKREKVLLGKLLS